MKFQCILCQIVRDLVRDLGKEMSLTFKEIDNKRVVKKTTISDGEGLLLEITPKGIKRWFFRYTIKGRARKMPLGYFPDLSLVEARKAAANHLAEVKGGKDPIALRDAALAAAVLAEQKAEHAAALESARMTFRQLFERWHSRQLVKGRKDGGAEIRRSFEKDILPKIGYLYADEITRLQVAALLDDIVARGARRMANLMLSNLRQCFGWAIGAGLLENDPTSHLKKESFGGKETERERILSDEELRRLLRHVLPESNLTDKAKSAVRILLSTAARVGELMTAKREHIDLEKREWLLPTTKNGKPHTIQLSDFAAEAMGEALNYYDHPVWLFPDRTGNDHVCEKTLTKQIGDRQREGKEPMTGRSKKVTCLALAGGRWTPHDLRRTAATVMGELGVRPDVIEKCLNHTDENKIKRTYQRQVMAPERRAAFDALGARLELLANDQTENVVLLQPRSA